MSNETRERLSLRVSPVTSYRLHTAYKKAGCRSMNELAERAIQFYLDYLEVGNAGDFLPTSLKSYVDGRLGKLEERLSSLSFKQTKAHASAFISSALEDHWPEVSQSDVYMKYIATRPRVERLGSHNLFGDEDIVDLDEAMSN